MLPQKKLLVLEAKTAKRCTQKGEEREAWLKRKADRQWLCVLSLLKKFCSPINQGKAKPQCSYQRFSKITDREKSVTLLIRNVRSRKAFGVRLAFVFPTLMKADKHELI
jgi:hypothetical protein